MKGLIPAWAGKTLVRRLGGHQAKAHPRVGGENAVEVDPAVVRVGSSPRGRGKPPIIPYALYRIRLIPAWAGKTLVVGGRACPPRAHPRVGGENSSCDRLVQPGSGSSPRGRGKLRKEMLSLTHGRLIPAWAGKTPCEAAADVAGEAHPRVGGENNKRRDRVA